MRLADIFTAMNLKPGATAADIGAGPGWITTRMAAAVGPRGSVYAIDIDTKRAIPALRKIAREHRNVKVIVGAPGNPKLPVPIGAALMASMYHEVVPREEMLRNVYAALEPGGRLAVYDIMPLRTASRPREVQAKNHRLSPAIAEAEFRAAGFEIVSREDAFADDPDEEESHWLIVCRKPGIRTSGAQD